MHYKKRGSLLWIQRVQQIYREFHDELAGRIRVAHVGSELSQADSALLHPLVLVGVKMDLNSINGNYLVCLYIDTRGIDHIGVTIPDMEQAAQFFKKSI